MKLMLELRVAQVNGDDETKNVYLVPSQTYEGLPHFQVNMTVTDVEAVKAFSAHGARFTLELEG